MNLAPNRICRASIIEGLEDRRLLAATIAFADGVLKVEGDVGVPNQIRIFSQLRLGNLVAMAGAVRTSVPLASVLAINVLGGDANDRVLLSDGLRIPATLDGGAGDDQLFGGAANDTIIGGPGNDKLVGRRGSDYIVGGGGQDVYVGGPGRNRYDRSQPQPIEAPPENPVPVPGAGPWLQAPYPDTVAQRPTTLQHPNGGTLSIGRSVKLFRNSDGVLVTGDGVHDDTTGIQRAIDSLPKSQGQPLGTIAVGGTIYLPPGEYRITQPLRVPGGVILSGAGPSTILHYVGLDRSAVEYINQGVDLCMGAGATDMTIIADSGGGFAVRPGTTLIVAEMRFRDIVLDTNGWGINFRGGNSYTQNCFFDNVLVRNVGAGGINVAGNTNKFNAIRTEGQVRPSFRAETGVVVVYGASAAISNCRLDGLPDNAVGFNISSPGGGSARLTNNTVTPAGAVAPARGSAPGYVFENIDGAYIDDLGGRIAKFTNCRGVRIGRQWVDGAAAEMARLLQADPLSRILVDDVFATQAAGTGNADKTTFHVTRWKQGAVGDYLAARGDSPALPASPALGRNATAVGVNVKEFVSNDGVSVRGDGVHDDTTGIQKAINLFLANRDNPNAPHSGAVYLPTGVYRISAPLTIPSGVVLIGDGSGTSIKYTGFGGVAVRFNDPSGTVTGAGLENLGIGAENGGGIGDVRGVPVVNSRFNDLVIQTSGWGIDLHDVRQSNFNNIFERQMGTGAVRIAGDHNDVFAVNTEFGVRPGYVPGPALLVVMGDYNSVTGCLIEGVPNGSSHGIYMSGTGDMIGNNWVELNSNGTLLAKDKIGFIFENLHDATFWDIGFLTSNQRAKFINSQVTFQILATAAEQWPMLSVCLLDANSTIKADFAISRYGNGDTGPAVTVTEQLVLAPAGDVTGGVWSGRGGWGSTN